MTEITLPDGKKLELADKYKLTNSRGQHYGDVVYNFNSKRWTLTKWTGGWANKMSNPRKGWAIDTEALNLMAVIHNATQGYYHPAKSPKVRSVVAIDSIFEARAADFATHGIEIDFGYGEQILLPDKYWYPYNQSSFQFIEDNGGEEKATVIAQLNDDLIKTMKGEDSA